MNSDTQEQQKEQQKEQSYRKTVLITIETLIDIESPSEIGAHLPHLHGVAWDEVVEERFVNKQCGFPACSGSPPKTRNGQMFHIDKKEGKIYETCKQRSKFCSLKCYHKSYFVRNQLEEQPLWITGLCGERMAKSYEIPGEDFICPVEPDSEADDVVDKSPEYVVDSIIAQVKTMKLNEEYIEPTEPVEAEPEQYRLTDDDKDFIRSIKQFRASNFGAPGARSAQNAQNAQNAPLKKVKLSPKDLKKEAELISKLRAKYGSQKMKKAPIIVEPHSMAKKSTSEQEEHKNEPEEAWLRALLNGWITAETRKMIKEGARPSNGLSEQMLMELLQGKRVDLEGSVELPNLDKYNVKEKRLNIFLHSVRNYWLELEARLQVTPTRRDILSRVAATFELNSENIVGWSKRELHAIVIALFIVIAFIDVELGDDFFGKEPSSELTAVSSELCGIESLTGLHHFIKKLCD